MWTMNFHMFKLVLEKAEEPDINLPTSAGSWKKQESSRETSILLYWLYQSLWLCGSWQTVENSSRDGNTDYFTCLLRNLYASQEATVKMGHGTTDWFQIEKGVFWGCILSSCLLNLYVECILQNTGLDEALDGIKICGRNISNLRYWDDTTIMTEN